MDGQKDIRPLSNLSDFFDKPPMRNSLSLNQSADRLYRRAERIVAGIFLATNHIPDTEPLRACVREAALNMLEHSLAVRDEMRAPQSNHASAFKASARYLVSLLRMLTIAGFLSVQNSTVLIEALDEIGTFLVTAQHSPLSDTASFSRQDFLDINPTSIKDVKDIRLQKDSKRIKDTIKMSDTPTKRTSNVRKDSIVEFLRTGGELGIADIAANLPEYSVKMIQRELAGLVAHGQVKKVGLKRWSRYSLAG